MCLLSAPSLAQCSSPPPLLMHTTREAFICTQTQLNTKRHLQIQKGTKWCIHTHRDTNTMAQTDIYTYIDTHREALQLTPAINRTAIQNRQSRLTNKEGRKENNSLLGEKEFPYLSKQTTAWVFLETWAKPSGGAAASPCIWLRHWERLQMMPTPSDV